LTYCLRLYCISEYTDDVLQVISQYSRDAWKNPVAEIVVYDSKFLLAFIASTLNPENYVHCVIAQDYLKFLERYKINYDPSLQARFQNETYRLSKVLLDDFSSQVEMGFDEYQKHKAQLIKNYFTDYLFRDYVHALELCTEILNSLSENEIPRFHQHLGTVLVNLAEADPGLFKKVVICIFQGGSWLHYSDYRVAKKLASGLYAKNLTAYLKFRCT
jgi:hypothetical protein